MNANQRRRDRRANPLSFEAMRYDLVRQLTNEASAKLAKSEQTALVDLGIKVGLLEPSGLRDGLGNRFVWRHGAPHENAEVLLCHHEGSVRLLNPTSGLPMPLDAHYLVGPIHEGISITADIPPHDHPSWPALIEKSISRTEPLFKKR